MHRNYSFAFVILIILSLNVVANNNNQCPRRKSKTISHTKCVAGRRFYARLDHIPNIFKSFSNRTIIQPYTFPWIAEIKTFYAGQRFVCSGTLINDRYILTAQHCVLPPLEPEHLTVTLGYYGTSQIEENVYAQYPVLSIILHPDYDPSDITSASNDLGLLKIEMVTYSKTIYPIQLPTIADKFYDLSNMIAENAGWSYANYRENSGHIYISKNFYQIGVKIIDDLECKNYNEFYRHYVTPGEICSVSLGTTTNSQFCDGDSGGPLMVEKEKRIYNVTVLIGVVSWSSPKNKPCLWYGSPVVYVRIDNKLPWIMSNTKDASYCRY